jgi:hypothetical protein
MASMAPVPALAYCAEKQRLMAKFAVAASQYLQALSDQIKSVSRGNGFGFEPEIKAARQRKDAAKRAILKHESLHGC